MKKLFIAITLIILAGLIAPTLIGGIVKTQYQSAFDKLNENPAITIHSNTFSQHWFNGKSTTEMSILLQSEELEDITFIIEEDLSFGPIIFTDEGVKFALNYSEANINFKESAIGDEVSTFIKNKLHFSSLITYSKNVVAIVKLDEVSKEIDGNKVVSAEAVGHFTVENDARIYGEFNWAGLTATTTDKAFNITGLKFLLDQTLVAGNYYQGNAISTGNLNFSIAAINAQDAAGKETLRVDGLRIGAVSTVDKDLMDINMNYHIDTAALNGQQFDSANLDIVFNRLNIHAMQEINTLMATISADGEDMLNAQNNEKISEIVGKLLADDPVFEIKDFSVKTPEGKIESAMHISIDKNSFDTTNIMSILTAIKADANGKAPMPFFTKLGLAPMVDIYLQQGLVILNEQELSFKVNYAQSQLNVNGNDISL